MSRGGGVTKGKKVGLWVLCFSCHTTPSRLFWARTLKLSQVIALWMRTRETHLKFWCDPWGCDQGLHLRGPKSILYKHRLLVMLYIKSKVMKSYWVECSGAKVCPEGMLGITRGQKVGFWVLSIVTQLLLGFLSHIVTQFSKCGDMRWRAIDLF